MLPNATKKYTIKFRQTLCKKKEVKKAGKKINKQNDKRHNVLT